MKPLFNFGITQDDYQVESQALKLGGSDLLCIASGGELPLSIASLYDSKIWAIDISETQLKLCRLKLLAAVNLDYTVAAAFLGFRKMKSSQRISYYRHIRSFLSEQDIEFWDTNQIAIQKGVINCARFENYIRRFSPLFLRIIGKKRLKALLEIDTIDEQERYFDKHLDKPVLRFVFEIVFSPLFYKGGGLEKAALRHASRQSLAKSFYGKFRQFLVSTKAADNFYLQYYLLGEIKKDSALPAYLKPENQERLRQNLDNITFSNVSLGDALEDPEIAKFGNFAISNVSDWASEKEMKQLLNAISKNCRNGLKVCLRYLHKDPTSPEVHKSFQVSDLNSDAAAINRDRFPFYSNYLLEC